MMVFISVIQ